MWRAHAKPSVDMRRAHMCNAVNTRLIMIGVKNPANVGLFSMHLCLEAGYKRKAAPVVNQDQQAFLLLTISRLWREHEGLEFFFLAPIRTPPGIPNDVIFFAVCRNHPLLWYMACFAQFNFFFAGGLDSSRQSGTQWVT
jgi:hypothetical protein